jgi:hypothetical protein
VNVQGERELIGDIVAVLEGLFPWGAPELSVRSPHADATPDADLAVPTPAGRATFPVVMKAALTPRAVEYLAAAGGDLGPPAVVVAPWLSPATRRALSERELNYVDVTGNVRLRDDTVPLLVTASGASRNPQPRKQRGTRGLSGTRAIEIVWAVTTLRPPFRMSDLIDAVGGGLNAAHVSRVLRGLAEEGLIERSPRGPVEGVDIAGVVERWLESYSFTSVHRPRPYVMLGPPTSLLETAKALDEPVRQRLGLTLTGPLVGYQLAPSVEPTLALAYTIDLVACEQALGLVPSDPEEANAYLALPQNRIVTDRPWMLEGLAVASPPIAAADLISLGGRNVDAGYSLLEWATRNRERWQVRPESIAAESLPW